MLNFGPTFIWNIVNLLVLYFVLKKVLFKPVMQHMENRKNSIQAALADVQKRTEQAEELNRKYDEQIRDVKDEAERILADARIRADKEYNLMIEHAKEEASMITAKAREDMARERAQMIKEIKNQVAGLALAAASKVLEANMDTESNKALVDKFIDEAGAA